MNSNDVAHFWEANADAWTRLSANALAFVAGQNSMKRGREVLAAAIETARQRQAQLVVEDTRAALDAFLT